MTRPRRVAIVGGLFAVTACSISPLQGRIDVGEEPFVVFVAEGSDGKTDLFASLPGGGEVSRLTFTDLAETSPRVTRDGGLVVFLRVRSPSEPMARDVVIMNLLSGAERRLELPGAAGTPTAVAWTADEAGVYARTSDGTWLVQAPPAEGHAVMLPADRSPAADSAFEVLLGSPAFAEAAPCPDGGICVTGPSGEPSRISERGTGPFRWGSDSLAWFEDGVIQVRPLGPGPARAVDWTDERVSGAREGSYAGTETGDR